MERERALSSYYQQGNVYARRIRAKLHIITTSSQAIILPQCYYKTLCG